MSSKKQEKGRDRSHMKMILPLTRTALVAYWMTSSARCSSDWGIESPRAFAVLRLMTSSNLVGCSPRLRLGGERRGEEAAPD